ncbi:MAG TPA: glycosyltransferase family 4 protein [Polyangiaceae bacterium]|jgi:glycosyltransferase involved in cell wall biosynthesis|nr:glycosyltransferase family 4 protein [Polyangiaceae bacterium]
MANKTPILFLHAQDGFGADAAVHADIVRQLDRDKFEIHVACTSGNGRREPPSLAIWRTLPDTKLRPTRFAPSLGSKNIAALIGAVRAGAAFSADFLALRKYVAREGIRIVHSTERPRDASYNIALSKATGARSVVHVHVKWSKSYSLPARLGVARADAVFSISRYVTSTLLAMGRPAASIHTILNGIDPSKWDPTIDGSELRRELGIPADTLVLASVSRLFSWKGQRELIRAFALVHAVIENVRLLIVGADASEVEGGSFSDELKQLASALGVREKVIFTGARSDVPRVMAACDVFSMPSFEEPFGLVFLEAMAMKRPVVAIDNGGTPEVVERGETGFLSPPWDIATLAANLLTLLRDPALCARMGERGRARVVEQFSSARMARDVEKAYEAILARG